MKKNYVTNGDKIKFLRAWWGHRADWCITTLKTDLGISEERIIRAVYAREIKNRYLYANKSGSVVILSDYPQTDLTWMERNVGTPLKPITSDAKRKIKFIVGNPDQVYHEVKFLMKV